MSVSSPNPSRIEVPFPDDDRVLRHVRVDAGYRLLTWDTGKYAARGTPLVGYAFYAPGILPVEPLFVGEKFSPSPGAAIDSDDALRALLGFLTLRPGDTDREYFDDYTAEQLAFAKSSECEYLQLYGREAESFDDPQDVPGFENIEGGR